MRWRLPYSQILIPLLLLGLLLSARFVFPVQIESIQLKIFDYFQRLYPRPYAAETPVRIVDIDDETLARVGQWPWPRHEMSRLLKILHEAGTAAVVLDIVYAEPDRTSPDQIVSLWPTTESAEEIKNRIREFPNHDRILADTMRDMRVVTAFSLTPEPNTAVPALKAGFAVSGSDPKPFLPVFQGAVVNIAPIAEAARGNGSFNIISETDGVIRRVPLIFRLRDQIYPSLVLEALRVAQEASTHVVKTAGGSGEASFADSTGIASVKTGRAVIPTDAQGRVWLRDSGFQTERFYPAWKILERDYAPELFENAIVLIGTSAAGLRDLRTTPLNPVAAGVEVHAQLLEQVLLGQFLHRPDWAPGAEWIYLALLGLIMIFMTARVGAAWCALLAFGFAAFAVGLSWYLFVSWNWLLDPVLPSLAVLIIYLASSLIHHLQTESEKKHIRGAFSRYMSPALVEKLARHPESLKLGGESRSMTFLFTDIRDFTSISEKLSAQELTRLMNEFLTPMTDVILGHSGTIDKYMGDCIMAFWNAPLEDPDHVHHACGAALAMRSALLDWNTSRKPAAPIEIGIGLNTGDACVGNVGSAQRFDYSVLGDAVNLASRLEGLTKTYGFSILAGETTCQAAPGFAWLEVDLIRVKGKQQPSRVYALLGPAGEAADPAFKSLSEENRAMLEAFRSQHWDSAEKMLQKMEKAGFSELKSYIALYRKRMDDFRRSAPGPAWDGVSLALSK